MKRMLLSLLVLAAVALSCSTTTTTSTATDTTGVATTVTDTAAVTTTTTVTTDTATMADTTGAPTVITGSFRTRYPNAANVVWSPYNRVTIPIDWEMTGWPALDAGDYVVEFDQDGKKYYAWYDASGAWIGSTTMLANHGDLPQPVRDLLVKKYNGYTIEKVEQEFDDQRTVYEIKLKRSDDDKVKLHVSDAGVVLKEKKKD